MARYKKGESGNPAGRPRGAKDKATQDLRATVTDFLHKNLPGVQAIYNKLPPAQKLAFLEKLLSYALPKLQSVELDADVELTGLSDSKLDSIIDKILSK